MGKAADEGAVAAAESVPAHVHNLYATVYSFNLFTITDGAIRVIVLLHLNNLGFSPISIALVFTLYELAGVLTNLFGGFVGVRHGLKLTLFVSVSLQVLGLTLLMLVTPIFGDLEDEASVSDDTRANVIVYITLCQMLSGISKDFMKLSCKSVPKLVTKPDDADDRLFKLVAWVTGLKNSFKGFGHLLGAVLVEFAGFEWAVGVLIVIIFAIIPVPALWMDRRLGQGSKKMARFTPKAFKGTWNINVLSLARIFLFGSRDTWFEIAAPIFIRESLAWPEFSVGLFMGAYIVMYGGLQTASTKLYHGSKADAEAGTSKGRVFSGPPTERSVPGWAYGTAGFLLLWGSVLYPLYRKDVEAKDAGGDDDTWQWAIGATLIVGLVFYAVGFAMNSAIHSYLIVLYASKDKLTMQIGSYYSANAMGRLVGTVLSGVIFQFTEEQFGLSVNLWVAAAFMAVAGFVGTFLRPHVEPTHPGKEHTGDTTASASV